MSDDVLRRILEAIEAEGWSQAARRRRRARG